MAFAFASHGPSLELQIKNYHIFLEATTCVAAINEKPNYAYALVRTILERRFEKVIGTKPFLSATVFFVLQTPLKSKVLAVFDQSLLFFQAFNL